MSTEQSEELRNLLAGLPVTPELLSFAQSLLTKRGRSPQVVSTPIAEPKDTYDHKTGEFITEAEWNKRYRTCTLTASGMRMSEEW